MIRATLTVMLMALPALAQDGPQYDPMALEQCLSGKTTPEQRESCIGVPADRCQQSPGGETTAGIGPRRPSAFTLRGSDTKVVA